MESASEPCDLRTLLLAWFDAQRRDLPWRRTKDPYAIWISEIMLQQTQVDTVIPYWNRFLTRFPTVEDLARAPLEEVLTLWRGLGYYSRARNLKTAAEHLVERFGAQVPSDLSDLLSLPGFGRYTAGAVASIAFGREAPLVDGNVARVFSRLFLIEGVPGTRDREKQLWALAEEWVRGPRPGDWNQALMELGAVVCRSDRPLCLLCPVRAHCGAYANGRVHALPPPKPRAARKSLTLGVALWRKGPKALMGRRAEKGLFGGLWELPSIELPSTDPPSSDSTDLSALSLQLSHACGARVSVREKLGEVSRTLTHRDLRLLLYRVEGDEKPSLAESPYVETRWVRPEEIEGLGMSTAMKHAWAAAHRA